MVRLVAGRRFGFPPIMAKSGPTYKTSNLKNLRCGRRRRKPGPRKFVMPRITPNLASVTILETPDKSESDKKSYRVIRLQNGLTALLISDPREYPVEIESPNESGADEEDDEEDADEEEEDDEEESEESDSSTEGEESESDNDSQPGEAKPTNFENKAAACSLCIGAGSFSDPANIQGIAHFVEHMVFMGSKKYPVENDFDAFIKKKGGFDNAQTDCEMTTFYFEVQENHLPEAMDRFTQFFIAPLMKQEAMQRERQSIESEFALALPLDGNRKDQLLCSTLPKGHPAGNFMWGNLISLTEPVGPDDNELHKAAHKFQKRHYSAHRMTLALQARYPLDLLEKYVVSTFGRIPTNNLPADNFSEHEFFSGFVTPEFNSLYYVKPTLQTINLTMTWCMRSFLNDYKTKPHLYVSWIMGHEGTGSLLLYLQRKVWAMGLTCGISEGGIEHNSLMSLFNLSIVLTEEGLKYADKVIEAVFGYINMMKREGPCERIFNEIRNIEEINFRFKDEPQPSDNVEQLSEYMQYLPPQYYMTGQDLLFEYDPKGIMYVLDCMSPYTVNIMLQSQKYAEPIVYDEVEEWFGTEFARTPLLKKTKERWMNFEPDKEFHLPEVNPFIPENFDLIPPPPDQADKLESLKAEDAKKDDPKEGEVANEAGTSDASKMELMPMVPEIKVSLKLVRNDELMEVWFKPDYRFNLPYTYVYIYFITPLSTESAASACLMDLWCTALTQIMTEKLYAADVTGLTRFLHTEEKGLMLKLHGFSQKLPIVVDHVTQMLTAYSEDLPVNLFEAIKDMHIKSYNNTIMKPSKLVKEVRLSMLMASYWSILEKLKALKTIMYEDLKFFGERFKERLYMKVLIQGNLLKEDALTISETIQNNMKWKAMSSEDKPRILINEIPLGDKQCRISSFNVADVNSVITNYYQYGVSDIKSSCIIEMLIQMMEEPLFNTLRTKEQLGYNVFCMMRYSNGILGFSITINVQAEKYSTGYVDSRIEAFMKGFFTTMKEMSDKSFEQSKMALIKLKSGVDVELKDEVRRYWAEIATSEYEFNKLRLEIDCLKDLTMKEIIAWWEEYAVCSSDTQRRKLSVQIVGHKPSKGEHASKRAKFGEQFEIDFTVQYMDVDENPNNYIRDINEFKKSLSVYPEKESPLDLNQIKS